MSDPICTSVEQTCTSIHYRCRRSVPWDGAVGHPCGAVGHLTGLNIYDTLLSVRDDSYIHTVEIPQREKTMAEFDINLGDTTISIDDDGLYDALEYKVDQAIEDWISNNLDVTDDVHQVFWDFNRWDEIISGNINYISVGELADGSEVMREGDLEGALETLLADFLRVTAGGRCGVGKVFADAVKRVMGEVLGSIEAQPDAFASNFEPMIRKVVRQEIKHAFSRAIGPLGSVEIPQTEQASA